MRRYHPASGRLATADAPQAGARRCSGQMTATILRRLPDQRRHARGRRPARVSSACEAVRRRRELDTISPVWQAALDSAGRRSTRTRPCCRRRRLRARRQRSLTASGASRAALLRQLARARGINPQPWLPASPVTPSLLGLGPSVRGCVFDLEGVLTDSGLLHAAAWADVFDSYLLRLAHDTGRHFIPFDRAGRLPDVPRWAVAHRGRARIPGQPRHPHPRGPPRGRLATQRPRTGSRGTRESCSSAPSSSAAWPCCPARAGICRRRATRGSDERSSRRARARCRCSSSSVSTTSSTPGSTPAPCSARASTASRSRPAARRLPTARRPAGGRRALTHSGAGVVAAQVPGLVVIGIGSGPQSELLRDFGAERVVPSLSALLDSRLALETRNANETPPPGRVRTPYFPATLARTVADAAANRTPAALGDGVDPSREVHDESQ